MPSITALTRIFFVSAACCVLVACGKANDQAPALSSVNKHPDTWLTEHRSAYQQNQDQCRGCHGVELQGGITKIDCFNQAGLGQCHAGGHGPRAAIHPVPFKGTPELNKAHGAMAKKDLVICQDCHATAGGAGSNPRFNLVYGSLPAGCESSGCHKQKMAHPKPWLTHSSSGNQSNACALCHGASFEGSSANGSPSCKNCHAGLVAGVTPVAGTCISCHSNPPNGAATAIPNRAGSHAVHLALPAMSGNCSACHTGGGSGTANHATTLTVAFAASVGSTATYNANNDSTCSNVSCHGFQKSPAWGASLDVIASCTGCHQSAAAYPGYHSGRHTKHLSEGIVCTDCHDMANQSAHFGNVTTNVFETAPNTTLRSYLNYNKTAQSCSVSSPTPPGVQNTGCHRDTKSWQ